MNRAIELSVAFLKTRPAGAAQALERITPADAAAFIETAPTPAAAVVLGHVQTAYATSVLEHSDPIKAANILSHMGTNEQSVLLRALPENRASEILSALPRREAARMRRYLAYGSGTVGAWMDTPKATFPVDVSVKDCLQEIRGLGARLGSAVLVVDAARKLLGVVDIDLLLSADDRTLLGDLMDRDFVSLSPQALLTSLVGLEAWDRALSLPVVDRRRQLAGVLHFDRLREGLVTDRGAVDTVQINILLSHLIQALLISISGLLNTALNEPNLTRLTEDTEG